MHIDPMMLLGADLDSQRCIFLRGCLVAAPAGQFALGSTSCDTTATIHQLKLSGPAGAGIVMVLAFGTQQFSTHHLSAFRVQAYFFETSFPAISRHDSILC